MDKKVLTINISRRTLFNILVLSAFVYALFFLKSLVLVVLTSVVLASFIRTSAEAARARFGMSRILSVVLMYLITFCFFAGVFYFFLPVLVVEISHLLPVVSQYIPENASFLGGFSLGDLSGIGAPAVDGVNTLLSNFEIFVGVILSGFGNTLSALFGGLLNVVLVVIISFYLSVSADGIESFLRILTPITKEAYVIDLWKRSQKKIALWMQGQMMLGLVVGILTFIGLSLLHVPQAILLAALAAIFELIPFGIFLAAVPAVSLGFSYGGITLALMVVALYVIVQQLEGYVFAPLVVNKMTGVSPLVVILSVLIGVSLAGFWGLILGVPVAVTMLEYINDLEKDRLVQAGNN